VLGHHRCNSGAHWQVGTGYTAKNHGSQIEDDKKYEDLRRKGYSKERAAKIANSGKKGSRTGGKHSH
jgi:hypothetical protein